MRKGRRNFLRVHRLIHQAGRRKARLYMRAMRRLRKVWRSTVIIVAVVDHSRGCELEEARPEHYGGQVDARKGDELCWGAIRRRSMVRKQKSETSPIGRFCDLFVSLTKGRCEDFTPVWMQRRRHVQIYHVQYLLMHLHAYGRRCTHAYGCVHLCIAFIRGCWGSSP